MDPVAPAVSDDIEIHRPYIDIRAYQYYPVSNVFYLGIYTTMNRVTAVDNDVDSPDKTLWVSGIVRNLQGTAGDPQPVALHITDDETAPEVTLSLSPPTIVENGGKTTVTATLDHPSEAQTTLSVSTFPPANFYTQSGHALTIAPGERTSTGVVRIVAIDNDLRDLRAGHRTVTVTATAANAHGIAGNPGPKTLTVEDDEHAPVVSLTPSPAVVPEGGESMVTAHLAHPVDEAVVVRVDADPAAAEWYSLSGNPLTIPARSLASTGAVRVTADDDRIDGPNRELLLSATVTDGEARPGSSRVLRITDNEGTPTVWLELADEAIAEGGSTTVKAHMSAPSSTAVSMRIAYHSRVTLSEFPVLRIPAGDTESVQQVTITAPDNAIHGAHEPVPIRATLFSAGPGIAPPGSVTLAIEDDEQAPVVTLELSQAPIVENGGETTVTARLDRHSSDDVLVTVDAIPVEVGPRFFVQQGITLTIRKGTLRSVGGVRITSLDNIEDAPDRTVMVTATAESGGTALLVPDDLTLTVVDDEPLPKVTLILTPDTVTEGDTVREGEATDFETEYTTVTAVMSNTSSKQVELTVASALIKGSGRHAQSGTVLRIAAGATESTGTVTITPVDDDIDTDNREVEVTATATGGNGVAPPPAQLLTILDTDDPPDLWFEVDNETIDEGKSAIVTLHSNRPWPRHCYF